MPFDAHIPHDYVPEERLRLEAYRGIATAVNDADVDAVGGDPRQKLLPYAETWQADLIVAGNSAKNLLLRKLFGETALSLLRKSQLPLYLSQ